ncbi:MAG: hypothetical protein R3F60_26180 [bacterium]
MGTEVIEGIGLVIEALNALAGGKGVPSVEGSFTDSVVDKTTYVGNSVALRWTGTFNTGTLIDQKNHVSTIWAELYDVEADQSIATSAKKDFKYIDYAEARYGQGVYARIGGYIWDSVIWWTPLGTNIADTGMAVSVSFDLSFVAADITPQAGRNYELRIYYLGYEPSFLHIGELVDDFNGRDDREPVKYPFTLHVRPPYELRFEAKTGLELTHGHRTRRTVLLTTYSERAGSIASMDFNGRTETFTPPLSIPALIKGETERCYAITVDVGHYGAGHEVVVSTEASARIGVGAASLIGWSNEAPIEASPIGLTDECPGTDPSSIDPVPEPALRVTVPSELRKSPREPRRIGMILDRAGTPLSGARIHLSQGTTVRTQVVETSSDGICSLDLSTLSDGPVTLHVEHRRVGSAMERLTSAQLADSHRPSRAGGGSQAHASTRVERAGNARVPFECIGLVAA